MDVSGDPGAINPVGSEPAGRAPTADEVSQAAVWLESLLNPLPGKSYLVGAGTGTEAASSGIGATDLVEDFLRQVGAAAATLDPKELGRPDQPEDTDESK